MKEIGILFKGEMVLPILDDRKTLTSRLMKPQPIHRVIQGDDGQWYDADCINPGRLLECKYQPGDTLIGREAWAFCTDGGNDLHLRYLADNSCAEIPQPHVAWAKKSVAVNGARGRPSIHLPYWASRLRLMVVKVWPSRLQDMNEKMAIQEGVSAEFMHDHSYNGGSTQTKSAYQAYAELWDRINAKSGHPWSKNEWVWRIQFKRITREAPQGR